jgi:hypothetical protein
VVIVWAAMSDRGGVLLRHLHSWGRHGLLAFLLQFFGSCRSKLYSIHGSGSGNKQTWVVKEKENLRGSGKHLLVVGGGGGGGGVVGGISSRHAGLWAAFLLAILSLLVIFNNASLISDHLHTQVVVYRQQHRVSSSSSSLLDGNAGGGGGLARGASSSSPPRRVKPERVSSPPKLPKSLFHPGRFRSKKDASSSSSSVSLVPIPHPCKGFKIPPPPTDKKRTGPRPCPVCYIPEAMAMSEMPEENRYVSPVLKQLSYVSNLGAIQPPFKGAAGSAFGGYPSLKEREESFNIGDSMRVHCGFVKGSTPGVGTGFDIDEDDRAEMYACQGVVVASAIFGNYDQLQQPKNVSQEAKKSVCFFMFVDEETESSLEENENFLSTKQVGLWRIVVVHNLPYTDARRNGKVPKLLLHRLFPNARFSLWVDGKLELVVDPYKILERFLWRTNETFAISEHYKRFDVFQEAEANKVAAKYDNASIDAQIKFYSSEGLTPYGTAKLPITSDVPEGCVIVREHTPIANLFSCLWFNEVDRFTPRDQLSFGIVRDKLAQKVPWQINMFKDCERRNFVVQGYHKDLLEHTATLTTNSEHSESSVDDVIAADLKSEVKPEVLPRKVESNTRNKKEGEGKGISLRKIRMLSRTTYQS